MIRILDNGVKIIELGLDNTQICQVVPKGDSASVGICFSNTDPSIDGITGEEIIVEIHGMKGVYAYLLAIINLLKTWNTTNNQDEQYNQEIENLRKLMNECLEDVTIEKHCKTCKHCLKNNPNGDICNKVCDKEYSAWEEVD